MIQVETPLVFLDDLLDQATDSAAYCVNRGSAALMPSAYCPWLGNYSDCFFERML